MEEVDSEGVVVEMFFSSAGSNGILYNAHLAHRETGSETHSCI